MKTTPQYPAIFALAVKFLIDEIEGGESNHAADKGGATNHGISDLRDGKKDGLIDINLDGTGDVKPEDLTRLDAEAMYYSEYWQALKCDLLPAPFAVFLFDCAVNHRPGTGERLLQQALQVSPDARIGKITIARAEQYAKSKSLTNQVLSFAFMHRARLYHDIAHGDSRQLKFLNGWFRRLFLMQQFILSLPTEVRS
jgi:lysozyme family protein